MPNDFVVELADTDFRRLDDHADSLGINWPRWREHAREQGYSFVGPCGFSGESGT